MSGESGTSFIPRGFWQINIGHLLIVVGMAGSAWAIVNNVEVTLADHTARIMSLERQLESQRESNDRWQRSTTEKLNAIAEDTANLRGQLTPLASPPLMRRGSLSAPHDGGG